MNELRDPDNPGIARVAAACFAGAVSGFILIALPSLIRWDHPKSLFDFVGAVVKGLSPGHILLMLAGGLFGPSMAIRGLRRTLPTSRLRGGCRRRNDSRPHVAQSLAF
jgi:hypothetical protein